jgi:hypothetical protein
MKKVLTERQKIVNSVSSEIDLLLSECVHKYDPNYHEVSPEIILHHVRKILQYAKVDSKIIVEILESGDFGEIGKMQSTYLKIEEGW